MVRVTQVDETKWRRVTIYIRGEDQPTHRGWIGYVSRNVNVYTRMTEDPDGILILRDGIGDPIILVRYGEIVLVELGQ